MFLFRPFFVLCFCAVVLFSNSYTEAQSLQVKPVGLSIAKPNPDSKFGGAYGGMQPGVKVMLLVGSKDRQIVDVKFDKQSPIAISAGGSILNDKESSSWQLLRPNVSKDGLRATLNLSSKKLPPAGTKDLAVEGKLQVTTGKETAEEKLEVPLTKGAKFQLVGIPVKISDVGKPDWGDEPLAVTLQTKGSDGFDKIRSLSFLDSDGKLIKSKTGGRTTINFGGNATISVEYRLAKKIDAATIQAVYYKDLKTDHLPLQLKVGLGL